MLFLEATRYGIPASAPAIETVGYASLNARYASLDALEAALNPTISGVTLYRGCVVRFDEANALPDKPIRGNFSITAEADEDWDAYEQIDVVVPSSLNNTPAVELINVGEAAWTIGDRAVSALLGGRSNHFDPKSLVLTETGAFEQLTGKPLGVIDGYGAKYVARDVGPVIAIVRRFKQNSGSSRVAPTHMRWR